MILHNVFNFQYALQWNHAHAYNIIDYCQRSEKRHSITPCSTSAKEEYITGDKEWFYILIYLLKALGS